MSFLLELVEGVLNLFDFVTDIGQQRWLLLYSRICAIEAFQEGLAAGSHLCLRCELRRELEHFENVLVGLIAEVSIEIELKWHYRKDQILIVKQVFNSHVLYEVELDLDEITFAETSLLALENDGIGLPTELVINLQIASFHCHLLMFAGGVK